MRIKVTYILPLFLLVLVLAGAGCLGTKAIPVNKTAPPSLLVDYHRTGGTTGSNDRLVIFDNGVAAISGGSANTEILLNDTELYVHFYAVQRIRLLTAPGQLPGASTEPGAYDLYGDVSG